MLKRLCAVLVALALCSSLFSCDVFSGKDDRTVITFSWWGGDSRHSATIEAIELFMEQNPDIKVECEYGAWTGWEETMTTRFFAGTAPDCLQINIPWISSFRKDGSCFADLSQYSSIDLSQYDEALLDECRADGTLAALPVSVTGRLFYWNETTFAAAGLSIPHTLAELLNAGTVFAEKLGDGYYPLVLGEYDRFLLMVYYLETIYGKPWVTGSTLNYTAGEIGVGIDFITMLESTHVIPTLRELQGDGTDTIDKNAKWIDGRYAGIFEWDSSVAKYKNALADGQNLIVGDYFSDIGKFQGGFTKISLGYSINAATEHPEECARLLNFLVSSEAATMILGSERGIPVNSAAYEICEANGLLDPLVLLANSRIRDWCSFTTDPHFEDASLKNSDGLYYDIMSGVSYGDYTREIAVQRLIDGIENVING